VIKLMKLKKANRVRVLKKVSERGWKTHKSYVRQDDGKWVHRKRLSDKEFKAVLEEFMKEGLQVDMYADPKNYNSLIDQRDEVRTIRRILSDGSCKGCLFHSVISDTCSINEFATSSNLSCMEYDDEDEEQYIWVLTK